MDTIIKDERREVIEKMHKDNVLNAAEELFSTKGYEKTTVDDIAHKSQYSKRTIYIYFKSKEEIYHNIILKGINLFKNYIREALKSHKDFIPRYYAMCKALESFYEDTPEYFNGIVAFQSKEISDDATKLSVSINNTSEEILLIIENFFIQGQSENIILKNIDLRKTIVIFWTNLIGLLSYTNNKENYIKKQIKSSREDFLNFGYNLLLNSVLDGGTYE